MTVPHFVEILTTIIEVVGVLTIVLGALVATFFVWRRHGPPGTLGWYVAYRRNLGRAILLGLEFLVAADIIRTVAQVPNLTSVTVLGIIVLIRTFLSFTLQMEIEGWPPWRTKTAGGAAPKQDESSAPPHRV